MTYEFVRISEAHRNEVMRIFNYYVEHSFAAYPEEPLPDIFFDKVLEMTKGYPAYVIFKKPKNKVCGFCFLRPYHPFSVFRETAEISYFIEESETGKGLGGQALKLLEEKAKEMGIRNILASISSLNEGSIRFHRHHGFRECGRFLNIGKKMKEDFDVIWMQKEIGN